MERSLDGIAREFYFLILKSVSELWILKHQVQ